MSTRFWKRALFCAAVLLSACGNNTERYLLPEISIDKKLRSAVKTVEVGRLDLPTYVRDSEINIQGEDGVLRPAQKGFWADDPDRALTELLAAGLDQALTAKVAAEPLPTAGIADLRVDIKIRRFVGVPGQNMQLAGQYFLSSPNGGTLQRIERFDITVPVTSKSINDYALAQSRAIKQLVGDLSVSISRVRQEEI